MNKQCNYRNLTTNTLSKNPTCLGFNKVCQKSNKSIVFQKADLLNG